MADLKKAKEEALKKVALKKAKDAALAKISEAKKPKPVEQEETGLLDDLGDAALSGLGTVGRELDRPAAALRGAVSTLGTEESALEAAKRGFADPGSVPTSKEIAAAEGLSTEESLGIPGTDFKFSPAGAAGLAADVALDPLNLVPGAAIAKGIGAGAKVAKTGAQLAGKAAGAAARPVKAAALEASSRATGIAKGDIQTFASNVNKIEKIFNKNKKNIARMSDNTKRALGLSIQKQKQGLGRAVRNTLENTENAAVANIDVKDLKKALEVEKAKLNKVTKAFDIKLIDDEIKIIDDLAGEKGLVSARDLNEIKQSMQESFKGFKPEAFAQVKGSGDRAGSILRRVSGQARSKLNEALPDIAPINNKLHRLFSIEKNMNKSLLAPGKPSSALVGAGRGETRERVILEDLSEILGEDLVKPAEELSSAAAFADPSFGAVDIASKGAIRTGGAAGIGATVGGTIGGIPGAALGGTLGAVATSPAALKAAIKTNDKVARALSTVTGFAADQADEAVEFLQNNPQAVRAMEQSLRQIDIQDRQQQQLEIREKALNETLLEEDVKAFPGRTPQKKLDAIVGAGKAAKILLSSAVEQANQMNSTDMMQMLESSALDSGSLGAKDYFQTMGSLAGTGGDVINPAGSAAGMSILLDVAKKYTPHNAKKMMAELAKMDGIPSLSKIDDMDVPEELKDELSSSLNASLAGIEEADTIKVTSPESQVEIRNYVDGLDSTIDQARILTKLNKSKEIKASDLMGFIKDGAQPRGDNPMLSLLKQEA